MLPIGEHCYQASKIATNKFVQIPKYWRNVRESLAYNLSNVHYFLRNLLFSAEMPIDISWHFMSCHAYCKWYFIISCWLQFTSIEMCFHISCTRADHDDVIKWRHFLRYWPFLRGIHRSPVNSPHKGQWREALMFSLICVWINSRINNPEAGDLRRHHAHYDVIVMF